MLCFHCARLRFKQVNYRRQIMKILFSLGPFSIHFFGVMIAVGILVSYLLALKEARRKNLDEEPVTNLVLYSILGGIIGARIGYIAFYNPLYYLANPLEIFAIISGGLSIHGGIIGGTLTGFLYARQKGLAIWQTADAIVPALILGQAIGRVGCDVFGVPMSQPYFWGIKINNTLLHPAQMYEFTLDYLFFGYLWLKRTNIKYNGQLLVSYLLFFPLIRSFVELFRDNPTVFSSFSISHLLSIILFMTGLTLRHYLLKQRLQQLINREPLSIKKITPVVMIVFAVIMFSLALFYLVQG
ncbi:MAG: prolipoprotein diacylglyceryl transferase [Peptococcaceae bacterium]